MRWLPWVVGILAFGAGFGLAALVYHLTWLPWGLEFFSLLLAGGFGGIAQALATGADRLRFPGLVPPDQETDRPAWDAGFLADAFIGMLGAVASLMFALALLSDKFFGVTQGQAQTDFPIPPWARMVAFGALTGFASRQLLPALSKRLVNMVTEQVRERVNQVEQRANNRLEAIQAQAEIAQLTAIAANPPPAVAAAAAAVAAPAAAAAAAFVATGAAAAPGWVYEIEHLVQQYNAINNPDYEARMAARMETARAMLVILDRAHVASAVLVPEVQNHPETAWVLVLATLIASRPEANDAVRLFDAYDLRLADAAVRRESKFILYRVLLAVIALYDSHHLPVAHRGRAQQIAQECLEIPDDRLRKRANAVLQLL